MSKAAQRQEAIQNIRALCAGEDNEIALQATIACELFRLVDGFDWVGFYRVVAPQLMKIGPYQGGHGCLTIPFDRGVCGAAAKTKTSQLVADVDAFPGHIACASSTKSELVVPVFDKAGEVTAVLDLDSDRPDFFDAEDRQVFESLMAEIFTKGLK